MAYPYNSYQYPYPYQQPIQQFQPQAMVPTQPQQMQPQQQQPVMTQTSIVWISNEKEAENFPIAPNAAVALWETSGKRIYMKSADATGRPTIKTFDLVEHVDAEVVDNQKEIPYATKEDLKTVVSAVKDLDGVISALRAEIDSIKGDVYGVVGKKRTARKTEVLDDDA